LLRRLFGERAAYTSLKPPDVRAADRRRAGQYLLTGPQNLQFALNAAPTVA